MNFRWTRWATDQWLQSLEYLQRENLLAAERISDGLLETLLVLTAHPYAGHVGKITGTREFAIPRSPFIVVYELDRFDRMLTVLTVFDGRRRWPKSFAKH